ncbi:MAG: hypothetical protein D6690_10745 [Nitrospirae bacterium]|nr:MAG: hypothetical protein D6690_10745 [Nitrospirota bacterium]
MIVTTTIVASMIANIIRRLAKARPTTKDHTKRIPTSTAMAPVALLGSPFLHTRKPLNTAIPA